MRGASGQVTRRALLTNVQQFTSEKSNGGDEPEQLTAVFGPKPPLQTLEIEDFDTRIATRGGSVAVLNDEAHHTHDEESEWNKIIRKVAREYKEDLFSQLDFTATRVTARAAVFLDGL